MPILNPADLTFNAKQIEELSQAVYESTFAKPELSLFHEFVPGIKAKQQIVILGRLNGLTGKGSGECDPTANTNTITNVEKFWDPEAVSNRFEECWTNLQETFFIWGTKNGIAKPDLTQTDFWTFLSERVSDALLEEVLRIVWFSDVDADNVAGGGVITDGVDLGYFNKIDGFWKQVFGIVAADSSRRTLGLDSRNGQATFAAQQFTTTDTDNSVVTNTLMNMKFEADYRLRGQEGLMYVVTQSVADQYQRELIECSKSYTCEAGVNGISVLKSGGITVFGFQFWDRMIAENFNDGAAAFLPHRALLLVKSNTQVGVDSEDSLSQMDSFYDKKSKQNIIDTLYCVDAKIAQDYQIQAAY
jgi:hypothetical protein